MKKLLKKWTDLSLFTKIMIGFVLGIIAGLLLGTKASSLAFLGTILTRLLTMVVAPLVLGLLICAAADVKDFKTLGKIGGRPLPFSWAVLPLPLPLALLPPTYSRLARASPSPARSVTMPKMCPAWWIP